MGQEFWNHSGRQRFRWTHKDGYPWNSHEWPGKSHRGIHTVRALPEGNVRCDVGRRMDRRGFVLPKQGSSEVQKQLLLNNTDEIKS